MSRGGPVSEHAQTLAALREIADALLRIEAKLGAPTPAPAGSRRVLSLSETAKAIRRGYEATRELVESGQIPGRQEGARWHIPLASVDAYLAGDDAA